MQLWVRSSRYFEAVSEKLDFSQKRRLRPRLAEFTLGHLRKSPVDKADVRHIVDHMKTATVRELRNEFPRIEAWVHEGESINISKRGKVIATLVPALGATAPQPRPPRVDIMARLRETWGGRVFTMEQVAAMRADELAEDLG